MKVKVKEKQSHKFDWTKNPQLVITDNGKIVLVHEDQGKASDSDCFVGTRLDDGYLSDYGTNWVKSNFKPFHGEITLKND